MRSSWAQILALVCLVAGGLRAAPVREALPASGWSLADFDGDLIPDLATTHSHRVSRGYTHEVSLKFAASPRHAFTIHDRFPRVELNARDLDGDQDRDIVVLAGFSREPVAVWLNDGAGNFHEGNLADYGRILNRRSSQSLHSLASRPLIPLGPTEQRVEARPLFDASVRPELSNVDAPDPKHAYYCEASSGASGRAPPLHF